MQLHELTITNTLTGSCGCDCSKNKIIYVPTADCRTTQRMTMQRSFKSL